MEENPPALSQLKRNGKPGPLGDDTSKSPMYAPANRERISLVKRQDIVPRNSCQANLAAVDTFESGDQFCPNQLFTRKNR
jgi:hypothetical protein